VCAPVGLFEFWRFRAFAGLMMLAVGTLLSAKAWAATSPTVTAPDPTSRPTTTSVPLIRDGDLSIFFPAKQRSGNAASAYVRAFDIFDADRDRLRFGDKYDALLKHGPMRAALEWITSGSLCKSSDFLPYLPDDLSRTTKFPYLIETLVLAKLLSVRADRELAANQREAALATGRTLMAFGRHLRASALVRDQEIQGITIEWLAVAVFQKAYSREADAVTSGKLTAVEHLLKASRDFLDEAATSHSAKGRPAFSADLAWLRSPHPVMRCEAILNMAQASLPSSVLIKPTPTIDDRLLLQRLEGATTTSKVRIRREEVEVKIEWPRKGVRRDVTPEDARRLREVLAPVAQSDPDQRVRTLARRFLDTLAEPKPTPAPQEGDAPSTSAKPISPAPRPPR